MALRKGAPLFAGGPTLFGMPELQLHQPSITDDDIAANQGYVRATLHQRLEDVWATCAPHLDGSLDRPDPRMAELGLRTIKESRDLWKLGQVVQAAPDTSGLTPREVAIAKAKKDLLELEARQG